MRDGDREHPHPHPPPVAEVHDVRDRAHRAEADAMRDRAEHEREHEGEAGDERGEVSGVVHMERRVRCSQSLSRECKLIVCKRADNVARSLAAYQPDVRRFHRDGRAPAT